MARGSKFSAWLAALLRARSWVHCLLCLQGEDVVRGSGMPAAIVRCCALTEEPGGAQLQLGQGDQLQASWGFTCRPLHL